MALALAPNIHNALFANGYVLTFDGVRRLEPRRRYIGIRYAQEIHEKLKFAKGDAGWGTLLAMEKKLEPVGITQLYPAFSEAENSWYVALAVPRRKAVYGYEKPRTNYASEMAALMGDLRRSSFHGPDTEGALFYIKESPGYFTQNPHCTAYWSTGAGSWTYVADEIKPKQRYPQLADFIGDAFAGGVFVPYPPPETKPKTVNEWDRPAGLTEGGLEERQRGRESLARLCPWADSPTVTRAWDATSGTGLGFTARLTRAEVSLRQQYMVEQPRPVYTTKWYQPQTVTRVGGFFEGLGNAAPVPPKALPKEPEPLSKNGGRFVMLEDPE